MYCNSTIQYVQKCSLKITRPIKFSVQAKYLSREMISGFTTPLNLFPNPVGGPNNMSKTTFMSSTGYSINISTAERLLRVCTWHLLPIEKIISFTLPTFLTLANGYILNFSSSVSSTTILLFCITIEKSCILSSKQSSWSYFTKEERFILPIQISSFLQIRLE